MRKLLVVLIIEAAAATCGLGYLLFTHVAFSGFWGARPGYVTGEGNV